MFGSNTVLWFTVLLILLQIKHFFVDFVISGKYMTRRASKTGWLLPLALHSGAHGAATLVLLIGPGYIIHQTWLIVAMAAVDTVAHFTIDMLRSRLFEYNVFQPSYWAVHGLDQLLHGITYVLIAAYICQSSLV